MGQTMGPRVALLLCGLACSLTVGQIELTADTVAKFERQGIADKKAEARTLHESVKELQAEPPALHAIRLRAQDEKNAIKAHDEQLAQQAAVAKTFAGRAERSSMETALGLYAVRDSVIASRFHNLQDTLKLLGPAPEDYHVRFKLVLHPRNQDKLEAALLNVSNPESSGYGHYLSKEVVDKMTAPAPEDIETVVAWLKEHNVAPSEVNGEFIKVSTSVEKAQKLFDAKLNLYEHSVDKTKQTRLAGKPRLPVEILKRVDLINGI